MPTFYTDWSDVHDTKIRYRCEYSESNIDIASNTSRVNWSVYTEVEPDYGGSGFRRLSSGYITVDGTTTSLVGSTSTQWHHNEFVKSGNKTITHNDDGSKTISLSMSITTQYNVTATGSKTFVLSTIPRASTVSVSPTVVDKVANPLQIAVDLKSTSFYHTVTWEVDKGDTTPVVLADKVQTTSFTVPYNDIKAKVGVYTAATITVRVTTYNGSGATAEQIGSEKTASTQYINRTNLPLSLYDDLEGDVGATIGAEADEGGFNVYLDTKFKLPNDITLSDTLQDYVIAQGIENGFTYRKWASGISECWRLYSFRASFSEWVSGIYESDAQGPFYYPTDLFIEKPVFSANVVAYSGLQGVELWNNSGNNVFTKDHTGLIYALSPRSLSTIEIDLHMKAIGRWK